MPTHGRISANYNTTSLHDSAFFEGYNALIDKCLLIQYNVNNDIIKDVYYRK